MSRSLKLGVTAAVALVLLGGGVAAARRGVTATVALAAPPLALGLARPDALIGPKRNRLFMAASQSLYAIYVNTQGAAPA